MTKSIWRNVSVDIETYSDVDIAKAGLYKYAQSPAFEVLLIAWAVDGGPVQVLDLTTDPGANGSGAEWQKLQEWIALWRADDVLWHAYNAAFEHYCLNVWAERIGLPQKAIGDWRCTMAHGLYCGYPAGLAAIGEAMGLPQDKKKLGVGAALIRRFCVPQKEKALPLLGDLRNETTLAKVRRWTRAEPEKWRLFKEYCAQDVVTEREIEKRLSQWPMPSREQILWELTTEANMTGVGVDRELVDAAIAIGEAEQERMTREAREISGLDNPKSVQQLMKWLNTEMETDGETEITDLRKGTVAEMLEKLRKGSDTSSGPSGHLPLKGKAFGDDGEGFGDDRVTRMLELRQQMSKTSTKKYDALAEATGEDGRVRGMLFYYGAARSGRWAGRIVQPQNLPQNHLANLDYARQLVKARDAELLALSYGSIPDALSQLIRTAFIPAPRPLAEAGDGLRAGQPNDLALRSSGRAPARGRLFAVADYSAIEARVVAWLAGETWVLDAFRAGQDIYCATASQMFGVPVEKHGVNAELRQRGKVATLALGYGGGEAALTAMGALKMGIPEEDLPEIKAKWRKANPAICNLWRRVEDAAIMCLRTGARQDVPIKVTDPQRARENEQRTGAAPGSYSDRFNTGLAIRFRHEADPVTNQDFLTVELPSGRRLFYAHPKLMPAKKFPDRESVHYMSTSQTTKKWGLTDTWGGKLVENITQAVARDCLAETLIRLRHRQMIAVFHVHDEVIVEVDDPNNLDTILGIMAEPIDWAPGLPLKGAGFCADYYQKD